MNSPGRHDQAQERSGSRARDRDSHDPVPLGSRSSPEERPVEGVVVMEAVIGTDGRVEDVQVMNAPDPDLGNAAVEAVRQWQFSTTLLNCTPIEVRMQVTVNFRIQP